MSPAEAAQLRKNAASLEETPLSNFEILEAACKLLLQGLDLLFLLNDRTYSRVVDMPFSTSIGNHYRRVLQHFQCLIRGFPAGELDYDAREKNARLEREVTYASVVTCDILRALNRLPADTLSCECKVVCRSGYTYPVASHDSNLSRELAYCTGEAVHHYSVIRLLCDTMNIQVPSEFGFAPSTLKHIATLATQ